MPLRTYEQFWTDYWRAPYPRLTDATWPGTIPFIAVSSGTTSGATKYIPVSHAMVRANRDAALDLLCHHVLNRPRSRVLAGKNLILGGSTAFTAPARGIRQGDLSGIAAATIPLWARSRVFPPRALALIDDWEEKVERLAAAALGQPITSINGTPSWLLLFLQRVAALAGGTLADAFPNLEMIAHGGIGFAPYRAAFAALLAGTRAETRELYPASEGFVAIADRGPGEGLRLNLDHGVFFEFVPLGAAAPTRHWVATVETGVNYAIVLSSCAGLWAYVIGDTVRFVERAPPRLLITGRTAYMLSAFGEHVIAEELEGAVADAAAAIGVPVIDFSAGAIHPPEARAPGSHVVIVEFADATPDGVIPDVSRFAARLDEGLAARNLDYRAHRAGDYGMAPPRIEVAPSGRFAAWMKQRGKLGGQHKVPRIITDATLLADLRRFIA